MDFGSGKAGERYTAKYLAKNGYKVIAKNYHSRFGEIDIIAENAEYIVFVEVKTREAGSQVSPVEAVTPSKQRKIISTARLYLSQYPTSKQPRFDVSAITTKNGKISDITYISNAFLT